MKIVPSRGDILKENIKKKKQYDRKMALLKFLKGLGISVLSLAIVFTCGIFVVNKIQTRREIFNLSKNGFYHIINLSSNQEINAVLHGNENSPYTIVPIHDIGEDDFNIFMDNILSPFDKTIQYTLINRPGHGFSGDSSRSRKADVIVKEYRDTLNELGVNNKLILVANGFGGVYATLWANEYPEQIAGIIYIGFEDYVDGFKTTEAKRDTAFNVLTCKLGFKRISNSDNIRTKSNLPDQDSSDILISFYMHSSSTTARNNEIAAAKSNYNTVMEKNTNSTQKILVASQGGFENKEDAMKYIKFKNAQNESLGLDPFVDMTDSKSTQQIEDLISNSKSILEKDKISFSGKITKIPGESRVYRQTPYAVQSLIKDFTLYVSGTTSNVKEKYKDEKAEGWEHYTKTQTER